MARNVFWHLLTFIPDSFLALGEVAEVVDRVAERGGRELWSEGGEWREGEGEGFQGWWRAMDIDRYAL